MLPVIKIKLLMADTVIVKHAIQLPYNISQLMITVKLLSLLFCKLHVSCCYMSIVGGMFIIVEIGVDEIENN